MDPQAIDQQLEASLHDSRLSRTERKDLRALLGELDPTDGPGLLLERAFAMARRQTPEPGQIATLEWLEDLASLVLAATQPASGSRPAEQAEAWFSPQDDCAHRIAQAIQSARTRIDACVFTITDDSIANALVAAHRAGRAVRIITDNEKSYDLGSDIERLEQAGLAVRCDRSEFHMHHKFALFDSTHLLTGSYNWTRGAARDNQENFILSSDPRLVEPFSRLFERLWNQLGN
jgi:phosphatidylserine/phosphatidylglycerophosphate/cardiolipin synthase-like enzyme